MYRFLDGPTSDRYAVGEALSRILEQRQQLLRDNVDLRRVQERIAATAGIVFSCRIVRYSSLNLDLAAGSFNDIAKAFENDFDSFRVFLEAFIPVAFAEVFSEESADRLTFSAAIPASAEQAFRAAIQIPSPPIVATPAPPLPTTQSTDARARAEWLWRLANGSLLVPLLLALVVMYQGLRMLNDIRGTQFEAIRPVLEHQLRLLEEDRHRLLRDSASATRPSSPLVGLPK
jgi:hypothetical protein